MYTCLRNYFSLQGYTCLQGYCVHLSKKLLYIVYKATVYTCLRKLVYIVIYKATVYYLSKKLETTLYSLQGYCVHLSKKLL